MTEKRKARIGAPPKPAAERRTVAVRFLVTPAEFDIIQEAAEFDASALESELTDRGLPDSMIQAMKRPSDWSRYVVMKFARPKAEEARKRRDSDARQIGARAADQHARIVREAIENVTGIPAGDLLKR